MKKNLLTFCLLLIFSNSFSQELDYTQKTENILSNSGKMTNKEFYIKAWEDSNMRIGDKLIILDYESIHSGADQSWIFARIKYRKDNTYTIVEKWMATASGIMSKVDQKEWKKNDKWAIEELNKATLIEY